MSNLQEDAKKLLPFVQAVAEGKTVQYKNRSGRFNNVEVIKDLLSLHPMTGGFMNVVDPTLRIKPEPRYRPYTRDEWEKVDKVRNKAQESTHTVFIVYDNLVHIAGFATYTFQEAMNAFENLDGSPCGVLEE